jgi:hypothetical protein
MSEIDVEKAAKRKLVSASLIMISLQAKMNKKYEMKQAMNEWKSFLNATLIAEGAFNKLLEINHRHSNARFTTASNLLLHLFKRNAGRALFKALIINSTRKTSKRASTNSPCSSGKQAVNKLNLQRLLLQSNSTGREPGSKQSQPHQEISYLEEPEVIQGENTTTTQQFEEEVINMGKNF